MKNHFQAVCLAVFLSFLFWQSLDAKALVLFFIALMFIEAGILFRRQTEVACPHCGFDAALYIKNQVAACEKVKTHLASRQQDPKVWLGMKPPVTVAQKAPQKPSPPLRSGKSSKEIVV